MKQVRILLFASTRDAVGQDALTLDLDEGATIGDLRRQLADRCPTIRDLIHRSMIAINDRYAHDDEAIPPIGEIACIPPVSGG